MAVANPPIRRLVFPGEAKKMAGGLPMPANQTFLSYRDEAPAKSPENEPPGPRRKLRRERAAAAATARGLRILEDEPSPHQAFLIIERGFMQVQIALRVHKPTRAMFFDDFVAVARLRIETHRVRQPRTAATLHANAQPTGFRRHAFLGQQLLNLGRRFFRHVNRCDFQMNLKTPSSARYLKIAPTAKNRLLPRCGVSCGRADFLLLFPVLDRRLDGVFSQHGTGNLHWRKAQLSTNVRVRDGQRFLDSLALDPFSRER